MIPHTFTAATLPGLAATPLLLHGAVGATDELIFIGLPLLIIALVWLLTRQEREDDGQDSTAPEE